MIGRMCGPNNVSQMRELFLSGRNNKDTTVLDDKEQKKSLKNKSAVDASPLSCFYELMYNPKTPLSLFFIVELDLKDKVIN